MSNLFTCGNISCKCQIASVGSASENARDFENIDKFKKMWVNLSLQGEG
jgi:hypothetical protein